MTQEILDTLFGDRDVLTDLIIHLTPTNDAERKQLQDLMVRRDRLTMVIQDVINGDIKNSTTGIDTAIKQLGDATAKLKALAKDLAAVASAISLVDQIVNVVTSVVTAAATA